MGSVIGARQLQGIRKEIFGDIPLSSVHRFEPLTT
jgi:hypothetical protein